VQRFIELYPFLYRPWSTPITLHLVQFGTCVTREQTQKRGVLLDLTSIIHSSMTDLQLQAGLVMVLVGNDG
jgi:hypothetical protein